MAIACFVGKSEIISPSKGATTFPSVGSIAIPFPIASEANASSTTVFKGIATPFNGLKTVNSFSLEVSSITLLIGSTTFFLN